MVSWNFLSCITAFWIAGAVAVSETPTSSFSLYAYGSGIGGFTVYYADGINVLGTCFGTRIANELYRRIVHW